MPLNSARALQFSQELIEWYWKLGFTRKGPYKLPAAGWLRDVYEARERVALAEESGKNLRPAFALWGPSQTGKSTLLSNFLDEKVWDGRQPGEPVDGSKSGLSWPGSTPCVFYVDLPGNETHLAEGLNSLNPFTGGRDASAVLTRFVRGSLTPGEGVFIPFPKYPVQLHFLGEKQVLHALAMGYDSECLGSPENRWQKTDLDKHGFLRILDQFNTVNSVPDSTAVDRQAYEVILGLCEVLEDLVIARVPRFHKLSLSTQAEEWQSLIRSLLDQPSLLKNAANARKFAAQLLWDGAEPISEYYGKVLEMLGSVQRWKDGRNVYTSLEVATKLLDMDTYDKVDKASRPLPKICYRVDGSSVLLDLDEGQPLVETVEQFGSLQGLVWEIVVPVNFDNLSPSKFTEFLSKGDLLDFPGVGNELANEVKRIAAWSNVAERQANLPEKQRLNLSKEQLFSPYLFFSKILKRGKTASIVSTYAKRMTIDGFTIFLYLDKHPPVNADQIQSGIKSWWSSMAPEYDQEVGGTSPLPLNLALTWWKDLFGTLRSLQMSGQEYFFTKTGIIRALGKISDPNVLWRTCALNYYKFNDRGKPVDASIPPAELFGSLLKEREVLLQFASAEIRHSLKNSITDEDGKSGVVLKQKFQGWLGEHGTRLHGDSDLMTLKDMLEDQDKGGSLYLLNMLCLQLDRLVQEKSQCKQLNRAKILAESLQRETARLERLLQGDFMFPPPETKDARRENLQKFKQNLEKAIILRPGNPPEFVPEEKMRRINLALRELLNVDYADLNMLPTFKHSINEAFVRGEFQSWSAKQAGRWGSDADESESNRSHSWKLLGFTGPAMVENILDYLASSLTPDQREDVAKWLRDDVRAGTEGLRGTLRRHDPRPFLAVKMSNLIMGSNVVEYDSEAEASKPPSYAAVIEPFLEHLQTNLIPASVKLREKVAVPGTAELLGLCEAFQVELTPPKTEAVTQT